MKKGKKILIVVFLILSIGIIGCIYQQGIFTKNTLAETFLVVFSLVYLISKYVASKIILKYQDNRYNPSKSKRRFDDLCVLINFNVIVPVSINLLYAGVILVIIKYFIPFEYSKLIAGFFSSIIEFNKSHVGFAITLITIVVGILTLSRYIAMKKYKAFKKLLKFVINPIKVISILMFFIGVDKGVNDRIVSHTFNSTPFKEFDVPLSFDANDQELKEKQELVVEGYDKYVTYIINRLEQKLDANTDDNEEDDSSGIVPNTERMASFVAKYPNLKETVKSSFTTSSKYNIGGYKESFEQYHTSIWSYEKASTKKSNLHDAVVSTSKSKIDNIIDVLSNPETEISPKKISQEGKILKELLSDVIWDFVPLEKVTDKIPFHAIIKTPLVNTLKDKITNSFYSFVIEKNDINKDLKILNDYIDTVLFKEYVKVKKVFKNKLRVLKSYYAELNNVVSNNFFEKMKQQKGNGRITYIEGLKQKLDINSSRILQLQIKKGSYYKELYNLIRKSNPNVSDEIINSHIRDKIIPVLKSGNKTLKGTLMEGSYKNLDYLKNKQSPGGVFLGKSISYQDPLNKFNETFYPVISKEDHPIIDQCSSIEINNDHIVIHLENGKRLRTMNDFVPEIALGAYFFVHNQPTHPALIDGFYNAESEKVFSYNTNVIYSDMLIDLMKDGDEFIFDVLQDSIHLKPVAKKINATSLKRL